MILLTQQIAKPLFIFSYKSKNHSFNHHVQLHQGFTFLNKFSQFPIMPISNGRSLKRRKNHNLNKCRTFSDSESGKSPLQTDPDKVFFCSYFSLLILLKFWLMGHWFYYKV
jgi:hypothetical protein